MDFIYGYNIITTSIIIGIVKETITPNQTLPRTYNLSNYWVTTTILNAAAIEPEAGEKDTRIKSGSGSVFSIFRRIALWSFNVQRAEFHWSMSIASWICSGVSYSAAIRYFTWCNNFFLFDCGAPRVGSSLRELKWTFWEVSLFHGSKMWVNVLVNFVLIQKSLSVTAANNHTCIMYF